MRAEGWPRFAPLGDAAILVQFGDAIDPEINARVHRLAAALAAANRAGFGEPVPAYTSVLLHYDPLQLDYAEVLREVQALLPGQELREMVSSARLVEIPVRYGGADGPDLDTVAATNNLTPQEVIAIHSGREYPVYLIGFLPGFPYLGGLDPRIATLRRESPRTLVPAGSVGIAGEQTGIYPLDSPGGWQLIGRTSSALFDPQREPPSLLAPGDRVRFVPVEGD